MRGFVKTWRRGVAASVALLLGAALATPCWAGDTTASPVSNVVGPLQAAMQARVATAGPAKAIRLAQAPDASAPASKPFFKSGKGVAVALLMAGGITWALVSRSQDAVHSPAR